MDPETPFEDDPRPLLCKAAGARNPPSVKALLAAPGIQVNARDPLYDGETVLMVALRNESLDVVEVLIRDERTDVNLRDGFYGRTALHYAVDSKSLMMVKCLLQRSGIEVDVKSSNGETPLCMAVGKGDVDMTRLLLEEGRADVTLAGCVSMTRRPLHFTVLRRYLKVVQVLADFMEVQVDPENGVSDTPLGHAISHRHRRVARVLKDFGAHDEKDDKRNYFWRKVIAGKRFICFA
ncbi:ankyrin [Choiromyces venosus 120613-1]|uniref:Ankyrin n=1 Tax=Choiromyces venosus 120613-1 TaxID=1336337 RepID=A0A3N4IVC2_9PEZI|nr:ankyrin [Choiromyces venosus 120613-1]